MNRRFPIHNGAQYIECGEPDCSARSEAARHGGRAGGHLPADAVARFFTHKGWKVGANARKDRCPDHAKPSRQPKQEPPQMAVDPKIAQIRPPQPGASEKPPREMSREDRRLIFAKLEEVYFDEKVGYAPGWNDQRVADDMACPRAWVAEIRDQNFGPQKAEQSEEIVNLNKRIATLETDANDLHKSADQLRRDGAALMEFAATIRSGGERLLKTAEALRADVKRLTGVQTI